MNIYWLYLLAMDLVFNMDNLRGIHVEVVEKCVVLHTRRMYKLRSWRNH